MTSTAAGPDGAAGQRTGIGVLGGSFDPPHRTHLRLAASALDVLPIRELRVIPAGDHPHKRAADMTPAAARVAMCRLAFAGLPGVVVDDREVTRAGPSFTVDTLAGLAAEFPDRRLWFLIGSDNLPLLPTWREPERIVELATIVTFPRLGHAVSRDALAALGWPAAHVDRLLAHVLPAPADATASSDVRARLRRGERDVPELVPAVRAYIDAHGLYR